MEPSRQDSVNTLLTERCKPGLSPTDAEPTEMMNAIRPDHDYRGVAEAIAPHLPYLRRYARALTGSQTRGDGYVAATLEAVIADQTVIDMTAGPRVGLYALFQKLWHATGAEPGADAAPGSRREQVALERLDALPPPSRQALLLTAVEGFDPAEAAAVMGTSIDETAGLVAEAVRALREQTRARVLIIEDEPIIAMDIEGVVEDLGHEVIGIADTRDAAVEAARSERPDLVLADIQLADGSSGIDAVRDILADFAVPVIFITAYPDRLLTGARPEPTFLISKPFRTETLQAAVSQALFFLSTERVEAAV